MITISSQFRFYKDAKGEGGKKENQTKNEVKGVCREGGSMIKMKSKRVKLKVLW
eukprot:m.1658 g.1658  ORF g.1658 m.1658 type:complete len:54 (+) comp875_c0_seq1:74-235(+)